MLSNTHPALVAFAKREHLIPTWYESSRLLTQLVKTLTQTVEHNVPSSLSMLDTSLEPDPQPEHNICVIDAGGTQLRVYHLKRRDTTPHTFTIRTIVRTQMPGTSGKAVSQKAFLEILTSYVAKLRHIITLPATTALPIKFSFSYPASIEPNQEVRPLKFTKEIKAQALIGMPLRSALQTSLQAAGLAEKPNLTILNDTVAVYLAGLQTCQNTNPASAAPAVVGIVYGSGFNICYQEQTATTQTIYNTEVGCYNGFPMTAIDASLDDRCDNPGEGLAEKRISGAYLSLLYREALVKFAQTPISDLLPAAADPLSPKLRTFLKNLHSSTNFPQNPELVTFLQTNTMPFLAQWNLNTEEQTILLGLLELLAWRSAFYAALLTAGISIRILQTQKPTELLFSMEGGMIQNFPNIASVYENCLKKWLKPFAVNWRLCIQEDAVPTGSAFAKWNSLR